jgi:curli biogenesis system outer membrane secretion channel CsgG
MSAVLRCLTVSPSTAAKPTDAAAAAAAKKHSSQQAVTDSLRSCHRFALAFNLGKASSIRMQQAMQGALRV